MFQDFKTEIKTFLIVALIAIVVTVGGILLLKTTGPEPAPSPTPTAQQIPPPVPEPQPQAEVLDTSDWNIYRSDEFGFEVRYPQDYYIVVYPNLGQVIKGPSDLAIFTDKFFGGLVYPGGGVIAKDEQLSLKNYLNYYYKATHYDNPSSGAYQNLEWSDIMSTDFF